MKTYKVDLDYESYLFNPDYHEENNDFLKLVREFEFVFFYINNEEASLKNLRDYSDDYIQKLVQLGFKKPQLNPFATDYIYWWGNRKNLELEKLLNSKITSAKCGKELDVGFFHGAIVSSLEDVQRHLSQNNFDKWILKSPTSFSGIGHQVFEKEHPPQKIYPQSLLEPFYQRIVDLGTTFICEDGELIDYFIVENKNSEKGSFKGGVAAKNRIIFKKYIWQKYQIDLAEYEKSCKKIFEYYQKIGATSNVQIDSFFYWDEKKKQAIMYPLVEVNYRKTMGLFLHSLASKILAKDNDVDDEVVDVVITHRGDIYSQDLNYILLSPPGNKFYSYAKIVKFLRRN